MQHPVIEIIGRAVILDKDNRLLVCAMTDCDWSFLPGGHVELGEKVEGAVIREVKEEIGLESKIVQFIGAMQNFYEVKGIQRHEINFVFHCELTDASAVIKSQESHLTFKFVAQKDLVNLKLLPESLKHRVINWMGDKSKIFWE